MKSRTVTILLICSLLFATSEQSLLSQNTSIRFRINSGNPVQFYFDQLDDYNNGLTYTNFTKVSVEFTDTTDLGVQTGLTWKLDVKATDSDISGTLGNLPLNTIELEATAGGGPPAVYSPVFALTDLDQSLVTNGTQTDLIAPVPTTVNISYYVGRSLTVPDNSLVGYLPDYYSVVLLLTVKPE